MTKITYKRSKENEFSIRTEKAAPMGNYQKLVDFLKQEIALREHVCTTNHAVLLDNAEKLLKEIGEYE